ncbi:MAG: hypothetical protein ACN6OY_00675 [Pseudomonas alloputida]
MIDPNTATIWTLLLNSASAVAAAISAFFAYWTIKTSTANAREERMAADKTRENERLLNHAVTTLERSFSVLMGGQLSLDFPPSDRIAWLTCARLLLDYQSTKTRITDPLLQQECESHEEYWRHNVFLKLEQISDQNYFSAGNIEKSSAVIVHAFSDWPNEKVDTIPKSSSESIDRYGVHPRWIRLRHHLGLL